MGNRWMEDLPRLSRAEDINDLDFSSFSSGTFPAVIKLNVEKVAQIKKRLNNKESLASIARAFGVTYQNIARIRDGQTWRGVEACD